MSFKRSISDKAISICYFFGFYGKGIHYSVIPNLIGNPELISNGFPPFFKGAGFFEGMTNRIEKFEKAVIEEER